jgi:hypothetical protein
MYCCKGILTYTCIAVKAGGPHASALTSAAQAPTLLEHGQCGFGCINGLEVAPTGGPSNLLRPTTCFLLLLAAAGQVLAVLIQHQPAVWSAALLLLLLLLGCWLFAG